MFDGLLIGAQQAAHGIVKTEALGHDIAGVLAHPGAKTRIATHLAHRGEQCIVIPRGISSPFHP